MRLENRKLLDAARGQSCTLRIQGACRNDRETVVACHIPDQYKGIGMKSSDLSHVHACMNCHDVIDGRVQSDEFAARQDWYILRALQRTIERLFTMGVYQIAHGSTKANERERSLSVNGEDF